MQRAIAGCDPERVGLLGQLQPQRQKQCDKNQHQHRQQHPANQPQDKQQNCHRASLPFQLAVIALGLLWLGVVLCLAVKRRKVIETAQSKYT